MAKMAGRKCVMEPESEFNLHPEMAKGDQTTTTSTSSSEQRKSVDVPSKKNAVAESFPWCRRCTTKGGQSVYHAWCTVCCKAVVYSTVLAICCIYVCMCRIFMVQHDS